jgi:hypothetical protein
VGDCFGPGQKTGPAQLAIAPKVVCHRRTQKLIGGAHLLVHLPPLDESDLSTKSPPPSDFATWYVQNVSTFSNTFAIVSPLICVFWIQLTWTNTVFSRIAPVSHFCAEIWLSGKILENIAKILLYQKTHGARRRDEGRQWTGLTTRGRGLGLAVPTCGEAASAVASTPPSTYIYLMTWKQRGFGVFPR